MNTFIYFAYGSNMLTERLRARCPSTRARGIAVAAGYRLEFFKRGKDKSGKATLVKLAQPGQQVFGVLFEIGIGGRPALDKAEGKGSGYDRIDDFTVNMLPDGTQAQVTTYLASCSAIDDRLKPFDWYHDLLIAGAEQHKLPEEYVVKLREYATIPDPHPNRNAPREAKAAIQKAGKLPTNLGPDPKC